MKLDINTEEWFIIYNNNLLKYLKIIKPIVHVSYPLILHINKSHPVKIIMNYCSIVSLERARHSFCTVLFCIWFHGIYCYVSSFYARTVFPEASQDGRETTTWRTWNKDLLFCPSKRSSYTRQGHVDTIRILVQELIVRHVF